MPESEPLTPEEVDALERIRDTWGSCETIWLIDSMERLIDTIRDRERRRGDWVEAGNVLSENCNEYSIEVFNLKQERDDLRRQLEEVRKALLTIADFLTRLSTGVATMKDAEQARAGLRRIAEGKL